MSLGFASYPSGSFVELMDKLEDGLPNLPKQEARVAQYMLLNVTTLGPETGKSLAIRVGVAEITVGRLMRRLGYNGTKDLKELLRQHYAVGGNTSVPQHDLAPHLRQALEAEISVIRNVFDQTTGKRWDKASELVSQSSSIFVTGFQSVSGLAKDFSVRLGLARPKVHYLSPHDGMLGEWITHDQASSTTECLVLVDVVPYAKEAAELIRISKEQGRKCIVVSDEFCHWSHNLADAVIYAPSITGLYLESTVGINIALSLLTDVAARKNANVSKQRLEWWKKNSRRLNLF